MANTSSAAAIDHLPPAATIVCVACGETMRRFRTITKLSVCPEKYVFVCPFCNRVDYKEPRKVA